MCSFNLAMKETQTPSCIHCGRDDSQVPLVVFNYREKEFRICTEHFPVLIHNPAQLTGKLPDVENLKPAEHD
jgi:hypothetical protein